MWDKGVGRGNVVFGPAVTHDYSNEGLRQKEPWFTVELGNRLENSFYDPFNDGVVGRSEASKI